MDSQKTEYVDVYDPFSGVFDDLFKPTGSKDSCFFFFLGRASWSHHPIVQHFLSKSIEAGRQ